MQASISETLDKQHEPTPVNSRSKVVIASLVGTAIEFFDFYIYATAAVIVFPHIFFLRVMPLSPRYSHWRPSRLRSLLALSAQRCLVTSVTVSVVKPPLVASLLTMGISTVVIGLLPSYQSIGVLAPLLLALARFGQGLGLGGEWGGAALLATENAPAKKRALYGSFPQLGAPIGFFLPTAPSCCSPGCWPTSSLCSGAGACLCAVCRAGPDWPVCARVAT